MYSLKKNYEKIYLNVSYDFSKFDGSKKMAGVNQQPPMHQLRMSPLNPFRG
jgi:hypothetical protein